MSQADTRLDRSSYLGHVRNETDAFVTAAYEEVFKECVPSCPDWNVYELAKHLWNVLTFWSLIAEHRLQHWRDVKKYDREEPELGELRDAIRDRSEALIATLEKGDPAESIWTWSNDKTLDFLPRRMAHETSVHRWDAEAATGVASPIPVELAPDGISEFIEHFFLRDTPWESDPIAVALSDGRHRWTLATNPWADDVATVSGTASDLVLLLWGRVDLNYLEVEGDGDAVRQLLTATDLS